MYEDLEAALLQADAGVAATQYLLDDLQGRVTRADVRDPSAVRQPARRQHRRLAGAAREAARHRRASADRDHGRRRQRRRQDHERRQAGALSDGCEPEGAACRCRHLSRRRARAVACLGRARRSAPGGRTGRGCRDAAVQSHRDRQPGRGRSSRPDLRRGRRRQGARLRRRHRRHGGTPGHAVAPDGRAEEDPAHDRQGAERRAARGAAGHRRQHRAERIDAGPGLRRRAAADRARHHQARRHGQGRRARRDRPLVARAGRRRCPCISSASASSSPTCRPFAPASSPRRWSR